MSVYLLDANVLIALSYSGHDHHQLAEAWLVQAGRVATCPITEGALVRFLVRTGQPARAAQAALRALAARPGAEFWPDGIGYADVDLGAVVGHRQVTDAYLVSLARARSGGRLATFDRGLGATYPGDTLVLA